MLRLILAAVVAAGAVAVAAAAARDSSASTKEQPDIIDAQTKSRAFNLTPDAPVLVRVKVPERFMDRNIYLEWVSERFPTAPVLLLASENGILPVIKYKARPKTSPPYRCSDKTPCFYADYNDARSFFTAPGYAFINIPPIKKDPLKVLLMYRFDDRNVAEQITGKLFFRAGKPVMCGGRGENKCAGQRCVLNEKVGIGQCSCRNNTAGQFCEARVQPYQREPSGTTIVQLKKGWNYWKYSQSLPSKVRKSYVELVARPMNTTKNTALSIFAKARGEKCNRAGAGGSDPDLPSDYDVNCRAPVSSNGVYERRSWSTLEENEVWIIAIYTNATDLLLDFNVVSCGYGRVDCRVDRQNPGSGERHDHVNAFSFLILPICLSILCLAAAVVCVLLYVDRRHGFVTGPDKLSPKELSLMCPEFVYDEEADEHQSDEEPQMCSICICNFEPGEALRKLQCDHRFHCECVDPWLTQANASCPTCRQEARVPELSERRYLRAVVKHVLAPLLRLPQRTRRRRLRATMSFRRTVSQTDLADARAVAERARSDLRSAASAAGDEGGAGDPDLPAPPAPVAALPDRPRRGSRRESSANSRPPSRRQSSERGARSPARARSRAGSRSGSRAGSRAGSNLSEMSDSSFATAPLNFANHPLTAHGVLPHVRAALTPARRLPPTVPTPPASPQAPQSPDLDAGPRPRT